MLTRSRRATLAPLGAPTAVVGASTLWVLLPWLGLQTLQAHLPPDILSALIAWAPVTVTIVALMNEIKLRWMAHAPRWLLVVVLTAVAGLVSGGVVLTDHSTLLPQHLRWWGVSALVVASSAVYWCGRGLALPPTLLQALGRGEIPHTSLLGVLLRPWIGRSDAAPDPWANGGPGDGPTPSEGRGDA